MQTINSTYYLYQESWRFLFVFWNDFFGIFIRSVPGEQIFLMQMRCQGFSRVPRGH